jgi:hypothetical protein
MPAFVIDAVLVFLIAGLTYALMSEGLWGAALMFFNVLFAGIIAFNFYEPLARLLATNVSFLSGFADTLCMMTLFIVAVLLLRLTTETLAPMMVRFPTPVYHAGRVLFALGGSLVTLAIILLAFEAAPVHKRVFTTVDFKSRPPFRLGIDHEWLGFFQYTTGQIFARQGPSRDWMGEYGNARVFDPKGEWLINHQDARPYGQETVLSEVAGEGGGGEAAGGGGGGGAPGAAAGGGAREGDPKIIGPSVGGGVVLPGN